MLINLRSSVEPTPQRPMHQSTPNPVSIRHVGGRPARHVNVPVTTHFRRWLDGWSALSEGVQTRFSLEPCPRHQATDEEEAMRSMAAVGDLRNELAAADEREAAARAALRDAERAAAAAQAEAGRARSAAAAAEERRAALEAELAQA